MLKVKRKFDLLRRVKVISSGDYRAFLNPAGRMVKNDIVSNIKKQVDVHGRRLKPNRPSTKRYKAKQGWGVKSLIAQFRLLVSPSTYIQKTSKKDVKIVLKPVRRKIGRYLEVKGYRFWGIGGKIRQSIFQRWISYIKRGLK